MPKINLKLSKKVFNQAYYSYLNDTTPTQIYFGGSSSGKSFFLAQRCVKDMAEGGRNYLILRKVQRDCKKSVWNEVVKKIKKFGLWNYVKTNKTELTITFPNGFQIFFGGLDDRERIKSITPEKGVITDIWLEEATEFEEEDLKQLEKRLRGSGDATTVKIKTKNETKVYKGFKQNAVKRIMLSFNPIIKTHWIYKRYFSKWEDNRNEYRDDRLCILKTTYKDNDFLTQDDIERLLDEEDQYYIDVYIKGKWGVLGNIIFKDNWEMRDISHMKDKLGRSAHGGDFGFSNDPAAVMKQYYDRSSKTLYIFDEIYQRGLTDRQLADRTKELIADEEVIFDSSEPKSIKHLNNYGVNARGAKKGPGSVETRYRWYKDIKIVLHVTCVNMKRELQIHQWKEDKDGNPLPTPEDKNNHAVDASMYGLSDYWNLNESSYYSQDYA